MKDNIINDIKFPIYFMGGEPDGFNMWLYKDTDDNEYLISLYKNDFKNCRRYILPNYYTLNSLYHICSTSLDKHTDEFLNYLFVYDDNIDSSLLFEDCGFWDEEEN